MTPEEHRLLKETAELARENNEILKKLHRARMWGRVLRGIYWLVIIGATFGAYYVIQPYIEQLMNLITGVKGGVESVQNVSENLPKLPSLKDTLQSFGNLFK